MVSLDFSSWYASTAQSGPSGLLLMQHSHPTLAFKPLILFPPTLYHLPLKSVPLNHTALFLSLLAKTALAYVPTALSVALRPSFPFQQAQYAQVFPLKPAPFCMLFAGLGSTNKSATSLLLSDSRHPVLSSIFPFILISGRNCLLSPVLSGYNGSPDTRFSRTTTRLNSWPDGERYLFPQQPLVVSLFSYLLYPLLSFRRLEAYCLVEILRHTGSLDFHRGTCASSSCSLCSLSPSLQRTVKLLSL